MNARSIVLVEDNRPIRYLIAHLLLEAGHRVLIATTGEVGVEIILKQRPDLVLLDLGLPGIDGFEVLKKVRADARAKDTPVVAFTATVMNGERERVLGAGFDGWIEKPIEPDQFLRDVDQLLATSVAANTS